MKDHRPATAFKPVTNPVGLAGASKVGGALSNYAVAAREYGIPAVEGIQATTSKIDDGQSIEVRGRLGIARFLID